MTKPLALIFLALLAAQSIAAGTNHIVNGDFKDNQCQDRYCTWNIDNFEGDSLPGWLPEPEMEIGKGKIYNKLLGKDKVLEMATSKNTCVKQIIPQLSKGAYELTVGYAARKNKPVADCEFEIFFGGEMLSHVKPADHQLYDEVLKVELEEDQTEVELKFCGGGEAKDNSFGAVLTQVALLGPSEEFESLNQESVVLKSQANQEGSRDAMEGRVNEIVASAPVETVEVLKGENLIKNGRLQDNQCTKSWCLWNESNFKQQSLPFWQPDPEIQIGNGNVYSDNLRATQVVFELAANKHTCVEQTVESVPKGAYSLSFDWAARKNRNMLDCEFSVYMNDELIDSFSPEDYAVHTDNVEFELDQELDATIRFCSSGDYPDNSYGAIITNFEMYEISEMSQPPVESEVEAEESELLVAAPAPVEVQRVITDSEEPMPQEVKSDGNLIKNGKLLENQCTKSWCLWKKGKFDPEYLPHWNTDSEIEMGNGNVYSKNLAQDVKVFELAASKHTCVYQTVPQLSRGSYSLSFEWAARKARDFLDCEFEVFVNDELVDSFTPEDYQVHSDRVEFDVKENNFDATVKFCSSGDYKENSYGAIITNFEMYAIGESAESELSIPEVEPISVAELEDPELLASVASPVSEDPELLASSALPVSEDPELLASEAPVVRAEQVIEVEHVETDPTDELPPFIKSNGNLIKNGLLEENQCSKSWCLWKKEEFKAENLPGWFSDSEIEIGKGKVYSNHMPKNRVVFELAANKHTCVQQTVSGLSLGEYSLSFDWAARKSREFQDCEFEVYVDDKLIDTFVPTDYLVHSDQIEFDVRENNFDATLKFCSSGDFKENSYGAIITNFELYQISDEVSHPGNEDQRAQEIAHVLEEEEMPISVAAEEQGEEYVPTPINEEELQHLSVEQEPFISSIASTSVISSDSSESESHGRVNLIKNGQLKDNQCRESWCLWNQKNFKSSSLPHWNPEPEVEIGYGSVYSNKLTQSKTVFELAANKHTCVSQTIPLLSQGGYDLSFDWAARKGRKFEDCEFTVFLGDREVDSFKPKDYEVHTDSVHFVIEKETKDVAVRFCSSGEDFKENSYGAIITNFGLYHGEAVESPREEKEEEIMELEKEIAELELELPEPQLMTEEEPLTFKPQKQITSEERESELIESQNSESQDSAESPEREPFIGASVKRSKKESKESTESKESLESQDSAEGLEREPFIGASVKRSKKEPKEKFEKEKQLQSEQSEASDDSEQEGSSLSSESEQLVNPLVIEESVVDKLGLSTPQSREPVVKQLSSESDEQELPEPYISVMNPAVPKPETISIPEIAEAETVSAPEFTEVSQAAEFPAQNSTVPSSPALEVPLIGTPVNHNLIRNPQLKQNRCHKSWCLWKEKNFAEDNVRYWYPEPEIEIGHGNIYSDSLGKETLVFELGGNKNTCVRQTIPSVSSGVYTLSFDWAARKSRKFEDCQFEVFLDNQLLEEFIPEDYGLVRDEIEFELEKDLKEVTLRFCGSGDAKSNGFGAVVTNFELIHEPFAQKPHEVVEEEVEEEELEELELEELEAELEEEDEDDDEIEQIQIGSEVPVVKKAKKQKGPKNYIRNGAFNSKHCKGQDTCSRTRETFSHEFLPFWTPSGDVEIGRKHFYNPNYGNKKNVGLHLSARKNACFQQKIQLQYGMYDLSFQFGAVVTESRPEPLEAFFLVKFNGRNARSILAVDDMPKREKLVVKSITGINILEFCVYGSDVEEPHGTVIDGVRLTLKEDLESMKTDFIVNGDFERNQCHGDFCVWNTDNFEETLLPGWTPNPRIEVGRGTNYNRHMGISTVAELSPNQNSCIGQYLNNCATGTYKLEFSWAARQSQRLHDSIFQVKVNGGVVQSYIPNDYMVHREVLILDLNKADNWLSFCSYGTNNNYGAVIDDVRMFMVEHCRGGETFKPQAMAVSR